MAGHLELPSGRRVEVQDGLVLGRVASCQVVLDDKKASRRHARIIVEGPVVEVEDLGSSNGTLLNDKPVKRRMLRGGDVLQIGATRITYVESQVDAAAPASGGIAPGEDLFGDSEDDGPSGTRSLPEPPSRPADHDEVEVLEFADDDVVTVRKTREPQPTTGSKSPPASQFHEPEVTVRPREEAPPARQVAAGKKPEPASAHRQHGVFLPPPRKGLPMGDDLQQMSLPMRLLVYALGLALAVGLGYLAMQMVS